MLKTFEKFSLSSMYLETTLANKNNVYDENRITINL
jgi:hypothetical protein